MGKVCRNYDLSQYFDGEEVLTSSELIKRLVKDGQSEENARQVIKRHAKENNVWRSSDLKLPRNERLFCPASLCTKPRFFAAIGKKLAASNRDGLARCLSVLAKRRVLHRADVMRLLAVGPAAGKTRQSQVRTYQGELKALREIGLYVGQQGEAFECIYRSSDDGDISGAHVAAALTSLRKEALLARVLVDRLREQNILGWNQTTVAEPSNPYTEFNGQIFSAYGFSYLTPLTHRKQDAASTTPCPVVIDCYHDSCGVAQVQSFVQRIQRTANRGKKRHPVLGVIGARDFQQEAWNEARSKGLMAINFRQMFGDAALEVMAQVEELIDCVGSNSSAVNSASRFNEFACMLDEVKSNPIVADLRAIGFEALSGLIIRNQGYEGVELGQIVPWKSTKRDIDVMAIRGSELRIIECKAYHKNKSLSDEEIRKFFTEAVPACKTWYRKNRRNFTSCTAEIWTTGRKGKVAGDALYRLPVPKSDYWGICRIKEITPLLIDPVRKRSLQLLRSIAGSGIDRSSPDDNDDE